METYFTGIDLSANKQKKRGRERGRIKSKERRFSAVDDGHESAVRLWRCCAMCQPNWRTRRAEEGTWRIRLCDPKDMALLLSLGKKKGLHTTFFSSSRNKGPFRRCLLSYAKHEREENFQND